MLRIDEPLLRVPQLAIHLDREINDKGLLLNRQQHLAPIWALEDDATEGGFVELLAQELKVDAADVIAWDVMAHTVEPARVAGAGGAFISAPRIDNQLSCYAGTEALTGAEVRDDRVAVLVLFDHEEVGSASDRGADGAFLASLLERLWLACGGGRADYLAALANGACVSADCAHATNPNYADRHEPAHTIALNAGPVLKVNANQRYATNAETAAIFVAACETADVPLQRFVNRTDLACGSTIGPLTASALGIPTVDVGAPQLAMHSARELAGSRDVGYLVAALGAYYALA
jgi:aspartyl aminopeptidase